MHPVSFSWVDPEGKRRLRVLFLVGVGLVFAATLILLRGVLTPVAIGLVLAYIADPFLDWLERHHVRRAVATSLLYVTCLALLMLMAMLLGPMIQHQGRRLYQQVSGVARDYGATMLTATPAGAKPKDGPQEAPDSAPPPSQSPPETKTSRPLRPEQGDILDAGRLRDYVRRHADELASRTLAAAFAIAQNAARGLSSAANFLFGLILVLVFAFFFMLHFRKMIEVMDHYLPAAHRDEVRRIAARIDSAVSDFFRGRLLVCALAGLVYVLGFRLSGIDFWLLLGLAAGVLGFIPVLGVILPLAPACALALLSDHPWPALIGILITFAVVQWVVEPLAGTAILSRQVKMHPVTILLSLLIGGSLFGVFGVILSVPLAAVVKILVQEFVLPPLRELAGGEPSSCP